MLSQFSCRSFGEVESRVHVIQGTRWLLSLRWTSTAGLMQVRGAKKRFGGITVDPYNHLKRKLRKAEMMKFQKTDLMSKERTLRKMELGLPLNYTSLNKVIATFIPLEKFAKAPLYTKLGLLQRLTNFRENLRTLYAGGIIKSKLKKVDPFRPAAFAVEAQEQFIEVNQALQVKDKRLLRELTTENATDVLKQEFPKNKQYVWEFVEELERPRVINARVEPIVDRDNLFAQLVVRFHSKQLMAVYNHRGEVVKGDPQTPKEIIDYVVFERHLVEPEKTSWRIAAKLPPQKHWKETMKEVSSSSSAQGKTTALPEPHKQSSITT